MLPTAAGYQFRSDKPRIESSNTRTLRVVASRIDCNPAAQPQVGDPSIPLWAIEGVGKGDALVSRGLYALALMGVWGFKGKNSFGGTTVLADLDAVACVIARPDTGWRRESRSTP